MKRTIHFLAMFGLAVSTQLNAEIPQNALWNQDKSVAVSTENLSKRTLVTAYVVQGVGKIKTIDLSVVEGQNLAKLGFYKTLKFEKIKTRPLKWIERNDDLLQITFQTQIWQNGQRYTSSESLLFKKDGTVLTR